MPSTHLAPKKPSAESEPPVALASRPAYQPPLYYQSIISLLKPLYRLQVWRRSHQRDNYQQEVAQRFGHDYPPRPFAQEAFNQKTIHQKTIWCHAVSLGETNTVAPLLDALLARGYQIWLTNTTQTGFARGASRFADDIAQGRLSHSYVPVDSPAVIETFLAHVQPVAALFVETELWANILSKLSEQHIPSILVNGRLSASSFKRYQKIAAVSASMMNNLTLIVAQDNESAKRFRQLGASSAQIRVAGSLKWVINSPKLDVQDSDAKVTATENQSIDTDTQKNKSAIATDLGIGGRPIWVAASTHNGEEDTVLAWQQQILSNSALADTLLVIVPRHPERFDEVAALIQKTGLKMARRSHEEAISAQTQVYLADSMGELMSWYAVADVALVGGSLVDVGGHNPVEPASVATPVLMGRHTQSCQSVVDTLASVGALYQPHNAFYCSIDVDGQAAQQHKSATEQQTSDDTALIYQQLVFWLRQPPLAKQAGQAGAQMTQQQQAVLSRQLSMIEDVIGQYSKSEML